MRIHLQWPGARFHVFGLALEDQVFTGTRNEQVKEGIYTSSHESESSANFGHPKAAFAFKKFMKNVIYMSPWIVHMIMIDSSPNENRSYYEKTEASN